MARSTVRVSVRAAGRGDANGAVERLGVLDLGGHDLDAVAAEFRAAAGAQVRRVEAIVAENAVHLMGGVVARLGTVEHQDASARAAEHERGVQTGRPGTDDDAVPGPTVGIAVHRLLPSSLIAPSTMARALLPILPGRAIGTQPAHLKIVGYSTAPPARAS